MPAAGRQFVPRAAELKRESCRLCLGPESLLEVNQVKQRQLEAAKILLDGAPLFFWHPLNPSRFDEATRRD